MGLFGGSKVRTKRVEPPARKLANMYLARELGRTWSGDLSPGERKTRQRLKSEALQDIDATTSGEMRALGEAGIEGPGQYNRIMRARRGGLASLIGARTQMDIARESRGPAIASNLLRENQPYTQTRTKQSGLSKAAPFMKMGGALLGGIFGGPAGAMAGSAIGGAVGDAGKGGPGQFTMDTAGASTGASLPQAGVGSAGQMGLEGLKTGTMTPPEGSAPLGATAGEGQSVPGMGTGAKKPGLTGNKMGLQRLQALFGGVG